MNRTDRLYAIREELRRSGNAGRTAERLAETFEVSPRTIKRDISALQQGGFPVWSQPGPGGGYVVDSSATLPPIAFTEAEVAGLASAVAALRGMPFEQEARSVLAKVLGVMEAGARERAESLTARVWTDSEGAAPASPAMRVIERALMESRVVSLDTEQFDPIFLARTQGTWFFVARARESTQIRWLRVGEVREARLTSIAAEPIPVDSVGTPPPTASAVGLT